MRPWAVRVWRPGGPGRSSMRRRRAAPYRPALRAEALAPGSLQRAARPPEKPRARRPPGAGRERRLVKSQKPAGGHAPWAPQGRIGALPAPIGGWGACCTIFERAPLTFSCRTPFRGRFAGSFSESLGPAKTGGAGRRGRQRCGLQQKFAGKACGLLKRGRARNDGRPRSQ